MIKFETVLTHAYYLESENVLFLRIKPEPEPSLKLTEQNFEQTYLALGERVVKVIMDTRHVDFIKFPKDVMEYMADNPYIKYQSANSILIKGLAQQILGNFYLKIVRPKVSTKLFTTLTGALEWQKVSDAVHLTNELNQLDRSVH